MRSDANRLFYDDSYQEASPSMSGDFGQQQFQRQQFKHKATDVGKSVDGETIRKSLNVPAKGLFFCGLLSIVLVVLGTIGAFVYGSSQTETMVDNLVWQIFGVDRTAKPSGKTTKFMEEEKERQDAQANAVLTVSVGVLIISAALLAAVYSLSMAGGILMGQLNNYKLCQIACIVAMVPVLSPLVVVGIPFGLMGFLKLRNPDVKKAFGSS